MRPALVDGPCYVTFSGGRDSSAVLAAATALARREGHALPIPVTRVYPDLPDTDESDWQRAVVDHLGLTEWVRLELRDGESDLLGAAARDALGQPRGAVAARPPDPRRDVRAPPRWVAADRRGRRRRARIALASPRWRSSCVAASTTGRWSSTRHRGAPPCAHVSGRARRMLRIQRPGPMAPPGRLRAACPARRGRLHAASRCATTPPPGPSPGSGPSRPSSHNHSAAAAEYGIRASDPLLDHRFVVSAGARRGRHRLPRTHRRPCRRCSPTSSRRPSSAGPRRRRSTTPTPGGHARVRPHVGRVRRRRGAGRRGAAPERLALRRADDGDGVLLHSAWLASEGLAP